MRVREKIQNRLGEPLLRKLRHSVDTMVERILETQVERESTKVLGLVYLFVLSVFLVKFQKSNRKPNSRIRGSMARVISPKLAEPKAVETASKFG